MEHLQRHGVTRSAIRGAVHTARRNVFEAVLNHARCGVPDRIAEITQTKTGGGPETAAREQPSLLNRW